MQSGISQLCRCSNTASRRQLLAAARDAYSLFISNSWLVPNALQVNNGTIIASLVRFESVLSSTSIKLSVLLLPHSFSISAFSITRSRRFFSVCASKSDARSSSIHAVASHASPRCGCWTLRRLLESTSDQACAFEVAGR